MSWFRENLRTLNFVANDPKLAVWTTELMQAIGEWENHITERASFQSSREKEFTKKLRLFNELESSLLSINQLLIIAQLDLQAESLLAQSDRQINNHTSNQAKNYTSNQTLDQTTNLTADKNQSKDSSKTNSNNQTNNLAIDKDQSKYLNKTNSNNQANYQANNQANSKNKSLTPLQYITSHSLANQYKINPKRVSDLTDLKLQHLIESQNEAQNHLQFLDTKTAKEEGSLLHVPAPIKIFTWEIEDNRYVKFSLVSWLETFTNLAQIVSPALDNDPTTIQDLQQQTSLSLKQIYTILEVDRNLKKAKAILNSLINSLKPWRKGPYKFLDQEVDAEWRSDLKWLRICDHLDLKDKYILDVGSGNGYHTWCMKQQNYQAKAVFAIEPFENFSLQHLISVILAKFTYANDNLTLRNLVSTDSNFSNSNLHYNWGYSSSSGVSSSGSVTNSSSHLYTTSLQQEIDSQTSIYTEQANQTELASQTEQTNQTDQNHTNSNSKSVKNQYIQILQQLTANAYSKNLTAPFMLPLPLQQVPAIAKFDVVFNMGVLYHRKDPIAFLEDLKGFLFDRADSTLVLETLVINGDVNTCLTPAGKYAGMDNVYHIPSIALLERWLNIAGFKNTKIIDLTVTTPEEQRATPLSSPISLIDFLDANDQSLTVEGYPAPKRVTILASRS